MASSNFEEVKLDDPTETDYLNASGDHVEVNIGLVGEAGSGKSSFVNAIMRNNNNEAAETGVITTTSEPKCYPHPANSNIKLWDLPSLGTAKYPDTKTYYKELQLANKYDAFLLFTRARLTFNSQRLAIRLESTQKPFVFIRTFIDLDVDNEKTTKPETFDEAKMMEEILKNILEGLKDLNSVSGEEIFLISNIKPEEWDFGRLNDEILYELPTRKSKVCMPIGLSARFKLAKLSLTEKKQNYKIDEKTLLESIDTHRVEAIKKKGIKGAQKLMKEELDGWKSIKLNLAIIGESGVGKSRFINSIRRITKHDDPNAAKTGPTETTMSPTEYPYPDNPNITLWDCPGINTPTFPDLETYCRHVDLKKYDALIIMTATRFTAHAGKLAGYLKSVGKPFIFARTKIDQDYQNEMGTKKSAFNEVAMLEEIKKDCSKNLNLIGVTLDDNDIFLISNVYLYRWDFARLTEAIEKRLPSLKRECFLFSMLILSENILERKVKTFKGKVKLVAVLQSIIVKVFTTDTYSRKKDFKLILEKVEFYRKQLGFPEQDTEEFQMMDPGLQKKVRRFYLTSEMNVESWLRKFDTNCGDEDTECGDEDPESDDKGTDCGLEEEILSWLDVNKAIEAPYKFVYRSLYGVLDEMKEIALEILKVATAKLDPDNDLAMG